MATIRTRIRKDGTPTFAVLYRHDGRQSSLSFDDAAAAQRFKELVNAAGPERALAALGVDHPAPTRGLTVEQWLNHHVEHLTGVAKSTVFDYRSYTRQIAASPLGALPLAALSRDDIALWVQQMTDAGASGKTIANKHGFVSSALNAAVKARHIGSNPAAGQRLPRTERPGMVFLSRDQYAALRDATTQPWQPLVEFLFASGARFGEVSALRPGDVDRDAATVRVSRAWKRTYAHGGYELGPPKTARSERVINVPAATLGKLDYTREFLFTNRTGGPVRIVGFRDRVWKPAVARAKLDPAPRIHDARHTCASWMIAAGVPLPVIQQHLGHESITTTVGTYGHLDRRSAEAAAEAIAKLLA